MKLHRYVFSESDFPPPMPKRVGRRLVELFLREILSRRDFEGAPLSRLKRLALFYDVQAIVPDLLGRLDAREKTELEIQTSIMLTEMVGMLGDGAQREAGRRYYRHLLTLPYKPDRLQEEFRLRALMDCLVAYTPEESNEGLLLRMDRALARLRPLARHNWEGIAGMEVRNIEDMRNVVVYRVKGVAAMKREIMQTSDPAKRLDVFVNIYMDIDQRYNEFVADWALHKIVRVGRNGDARAVIAAFRRILSRLPRESGEDALRARALHAIEYFGGEITPTERAQRRTFENNFDPLSFKEF